MRLTEADRTATLNDHLAHFRELLLVHPDFLIAPPDAAHPGGYGLPAIEADWLIYQAKRDALITLSDTTIAAQIEERDTEFGRSSEDFNGIWYKLTLYKGAVRLKAPAFRGSVPNIGVPTPGNYLAILKAFIDHWTLVNAALPAGAGLTIGDLDLPGLIAKRDQLKTLIDDMDETRTTRLNVLRAEKEEFMGDVPSLLRRPDSIIARLEAYHQGVLENFPGPPFSTTLPNIFPSQAGQNDEAPTFRFNFRQNAGEVIVWFERPDVTGGAAIWLKEGAFEVSQPLAPDSSTATFNGLTVVDNLDELEIRDADGRTLATGTFDATLQEPI